MSRMKGHCLCGAVSFEAEIPSHDVTVCHCGMGRRWGSAPLTGLETGNAPVFAGEVDIAIYKSSDWEKRGFCRRCGTNLFWRLGDGSFWSLCVGTLDDRSELSLRTEIFTESKPPFYAFANDTKKLSGAEVMAHLAGGSNKD